MKQIIIIAILVWTLVGCTNEGQVNVAFDNSTGLTEESPVLINGYQIGEVERLTLLDDKRTLVTIGFTEEIDIPVDSRFQIEKNSLFGDASISLGLGNSLTLVSPGDTINGTYSTEQSEIEKGIQRVIENLVEATDTLRLDSIKRKK
jgi:phospholipid/cholesterol/gamma-HCH transport system substrate-binding protein